MRTFIINLKNYPEILGERGLTLAKTAESVAERLPVELVMAPPHPLVARFARETRLQVFAQSVSDAPTGASTGAIVAEALKASGAAGTLLNHSEAQVPMATVESLLPRLKREGLKVCVCAKTADEAAVLAMLKPDFVAIEPPELIGSGIAVSRARPELLSETVTAARSSKYSGKVLCGAGIVDGADVARAVALGVDGILVASAIVKARDWAAKIAELAQALVG
ncbi:MAG TPA: triose-phosphate isomerase [Nitrososphaerales archaeon]|nr:triose-phosphate isomerase [Nitrososphaerales archaeon]